MKKKITLKITITAILSALSLICFLIENLLPPIFIPGAKIGLSNVFILMAIFMAGYPYAFAVLLIKIVLGSIFSGNVSAMLYSLPAGLISIGLEIILIRLKKFSILSVSVIGSVINLTVQNAVFCLITNTVEYFTFLPYLALIGVASGALIGIIVYLLQKFLPNKFFITD